VDRVAPSELQIGRDEVAMPTQGVLTRTWWVEDLPDRMIFESLDPLLHFPGRVAVSMLVEPIPPAEAMQALRQERSSRYAGFITRGQQGRLSDPGAVADLQSMEKELADLQIARRFPLSLYWVIGLSAHQATWRHEAALKSLLPLGVNFLGDRRNVNADTMACLQKNGRLHSRSVVQLRNLVEQVERLNFAGDADLDAMLAGVRMQLDLAAEDRSVREVERVLRDVAVVTRSTLIGLGEQPRSARSLGVPDQPAPELVRTARGRLSLGEGAQALPLPGMGTPRSARTALQAVAVPA
jgi:hypothetical protein